MLIRPTWERWFRSATMGIWRFGDGLFTMGRASTTAIFFLHSENWGIPKWGFPWYNAKNHHSKSSQKSSEESVLGCWLSFWPAPIQVSDAYIKKRHHNQALSSHSRDISPKKGLTGVISSYRLTFIDSHSYNIVILFPVISSYDFSVSENHIHYL